MKDTEAILVILFYILFLFYGIWLAGSGKFRKFMHSKIELVRESEAEDE